MSFPQHLQFFQHSCDTLVAAVHVKLRPGIVPLLTELFDALLHRGHFWQITAKNQRLDRIRQGLQVARYRSSALWAQGDRAAAGCPRITRQILPAAQRYIQDDRIGRKDILRTLSHFTHYPPYLQSLL